MGPSQPIVGQVWADDLVEPDRCHEERNSLARLLDDPPIPEIIPSIPVKEIFGHAEELVGRQVDDPVFEHDSPQRSLDIAGAAMRNNSKSALPKCWAIQDHDSVELPPQ